MERIAVVGLGIIGASLARAFTASGCEVHGYDLNEETLEYALQKKYIAEKMTEFSSYQTVFLAIPPKATIEMLTSAVFQDGAFVADICGVKECIEEAVYAQPRNYRYVGLHPMAGKETSGIESSSATLFAGANLVITVAKQTDQTALFQAREFAKRLQFGRIIECTAKQHDEKIALTSQLAHIVSNAYVKSEQVLGCEGFTGGSFQDMTRIAGVDDVMWTQLYMLNRNYLLKELNGLINHLNEYRIALEEKDEKAMREALSAGKNIRKKIKHKND